MAKTLSSREVVGALVGAYLLAGFCGGSLLPPSIVTTGLGDVGVRFVVVGLVIPVLIVIGAILDVRVSNALPGWFRASIGRWKRLFRNGAGRSDAP